MTTISEYLALEDGPGPVVRDTLTRCRDGLLSEDEASERLDQQHIHGGWSAGDFSGYDYDNQRWIVFAHGHLAVSS